MPAPTTVTDQAVIEAGRQLTTEGKPVTGWRLRTVLGAGNPTRMGKIWEAHAAEMAEETQAPTPPPLPADLETQATAFQMRVAAELDSMIMAAWQTAERTAMDRTKTEVDAARDATKRTTADLELAEQAIADAETERDQATVMAEQLRIQLHEARAEADRQRGHAEAANTQAQRAEAAAAAALETARMGAEERGRLLERLERAEADLQAQKAQQAGKARNVTDHAVDHGV